MSGHKLSTDRVDGTIVSECPNGCDCSVVVDYTDAVDNDVLADHKQLVKECRNCGAEMAYVQQEEPSEVLE